MRDVSRPWITAVAIAAATINLRAPSELRAQVASDAQSPSGSGTFFTRRDGYAAGAFLVATAGISHFDPAIEHFFRDTAWRHVRIGRTLDGVFTNFNETTLTIAGIATYGLGWLVRSPTLAADGLHATEAVAGASIASQLIRGPLGRSRPAVTDDSNQYDFHFFEGFTHFADRAFPSIHSSSGFAFATVLVQETRFQDPRAVWFVAPVAYAFALTPGLSRLYLGQHWPSDVFAGAFMGTLAGLKAVDYAHAHPDNWMDRHLLPQPSLRLVF
jgi:membrane-associated phospholipid phosphatase